MPKARGEPAGASAQTPARPASRPSGVTPHKAPARPPARTLVWARPDQTALLRRVADLASLKVVAAGSPEPGRGGQIASALGGDHATDLRAALASTDADLALLADPGAFGSGTGDDDIGAIVAARARGVVIASFEPVPPAGLDMANPAWTDTRAGGRAIDAVHPAALPRRARPFGELRDLLDQFGPVRSMSGEVVVPAAAGSLGSALVGAVDLVLGLLGEPESIDAAYVGPGAGTSLRALPAQSLRGLSGDLGAMARLPDGRAACLLASDRAGAWACSVTLLGDAGVLRIADGGFVWTDRAGAVVDRHDAAPEPGHRIHSGPDAAAWVIAEQLARLLDPAGPEDAPVDLPTVLAIAQAALLSARTGQAESPQTIQRLVSRR